LKLIKLIGNLFLLPLYWFSLIVPRDPNLWVFGSWFGTRYSDSSRYVYEYIIHHEPEIRAIWLTRKKSIVYELRTKGYECYSIYSLKGYWYTCRAAAALFTVNITDINTLGASRLLKFQLWHGIPLKKIVYDDKLNLPTPTKKGLGINILHKLKSTLFPYLNVFSQWDAVASTSPKVSKIFSSAFRLPENKVIITGTPRSDIILNSTLTLPKRLEPGNQRIQRRIGYFPTHRVNPQPLSEFINSINTSGLPEFLENNNTVLYIKLHYFNLNKLAKLVNPPRIIFLEEHDVPDINYLLPVLDILITDYSSVFYDYLLLDRPMIFTPFDLADYMLGDRELYGDYDELTPGPKCMTWDEVVDSLFDIYFKEDSYKEVRHAMRRKYYTYTDTNNSQRVVQAVKSLLK
jgi:CDP-glycerol glycerophosphotransferase (TagB/SpsB family)